VVSIGLGRPHPRHQPPVHHGNCAADAWTEVRVAASADASHKRFYRCPAPAVTINSLRSHSKSRLTLRHTRRMADLGYDADFLDTELAPPMTRDDDASTTAERTPLDYMHFTVRMHPTRRLAWWVDWNIDGLRLFPSDSISRSGESFRLDPRIPAAAQTGEQAYADNDLDRGHIARRSDLLWGALNEAQLANSDSFHFTNITPQTADSTSPDAAEPGACSRTRS
jgi:DNA/RNA endonuclease G (NUC1)